MLPFQYIQYTYTEMELMEIGNFRFVAANWKNGNGKLPFVFCKWKTDYCFL